MLARRKIVIVLLCIFILAAGIFIWRKEKNSAEVKKSADSQVKTAQSVDENISPTVKTYTDPQLGFAFDYPDNFKLKTSADGDQDSITINGEDGKNGLQILVGTYDEKDPLSLTVIKNDAGTLTVTDEKGIAIGQKNPVQGFSFTLKNPDADPGDVSADLAEIWFVRNGKLYQLASYADFSQYLGKILQSFRFD